MPRGDRTGPMGYGPMTGRGMGYCAGYPTPGYMNSGPGFGYGRGMGFARGFGRGMGRGLGMGWGRSRFADYPVQPQPEGYYQAAPDMTGLSSEEELSYLKKQAEDISQYMKDITKRIAELEKKK